MSIIEAIVLGLVQGIAEYLPISSSGHLVLVQKILDFQEPVVFIEVLLHFATITAIVIFFRKRILQLKRPELVNLLYASVPAALVGYLLGSQILGIFHSIEWVALMLIVTGFINLFIDKIIQERIASGVDNQKKHEPNELSAKEAVIVGFYQVLALIPGISRSGATVFGGLKQGLSRTEAFEFSFLMAVPIIFGASIFEFSRTDMSVVSSIGVSALVVAFITALLTGLGSLKLLAYITKEAKFKWFAYYCWAIGITTIAVIFFL